MRRSQRKPSVRKKATRRQAPRTARRRARARGGGYGAGPQSGGMAPLLGYLFSPLLSLTLPGFILMVVGWLVIFFLIDHAARAQRSARLKVLRETSEPAVVDSSRALVLGGSE